MKILIIRPFPDKLNLNSYNVQEVGLAKALVKKEHVCDIVLYNGKEKDCIQEYTFFHEGEKLGFKIYWMQGFKLFKNGFMPSVKKIVSQYDVVQVHEYDQIMSWDLYTKQMVPTVVYHGPYYDAFARGYNLKCRVFDAFFLPLRKNRDVIAISKSILASRFLEEKGFKNVITAGVGLDVENFGSLEQTEENDNLSNSCKQILYIGKLEERRNLFFLIEVFRKLQKKDAGYRFVIIGNGEKEYKDKFLVSIKDELENGSIEYHEKAAQKELVKYYKNSAFFVLASQYEIFGMVLLEAMYFGTPVISSINGGSCTLIQSGYNGYVMEEFDSDKWSECIHNSIQDKDKINKLKVNAKSTIEEGFTWDRIADKFIRAYENAINEK